MQLWFDINKASYNGLHKIRHDNEVFPIKKIGTYYTYYHDDDDLISLVISFRRCVYFTCIHPKRISRRLFVSVSHMQREMLFRGRIKTARIQVSHGQAPSMSSALTASSIQCVPFHRWRVIVPHVCKNATYHEKIVVTAGINYVNTKLIQLFS